MQLSAHFSYEEAIRSASARQLRIDNTPDAKVLGNLYYTAGRMEEVRALLGQPLEVSSWFRCLALNLAIGGSKTSAHKDGLAVDFTCAPYGTVLQVCHTIANSKLAFDQLIYEYGRWVHIGFAIDKPQRRQLLTKLAGQPYAVGLPALTQRGT
jgi:hypothetical protein